MKIAIVCDWLVTYAGAERVLEEIIHCYPDADLFSVVDFLEDSKRGFLQNKKATTTFIQKLPFAKKRYRSYLPFMPLAIEQLDVSSYDLIISSSHAVAKGIITGPNQTHICYIHSPMRYAWDLQHQYLKETGLDKGIKGLVTKYLLHRLRAWDLRTVNGVDHFIANSNYIAKRVWKTYHRESAVIYPPVQLDAFEPLAKKEDFYLTASRLVPYKKIDLIVESFKQLPNKKLVVIGDGPEMPKIKEKAQQSPNIEILGYQSAEKLHDYLRRAKAFLFAAEEDFGIVPLEAQACGTPVIAFGKGGALETVRDIQQKNPTGVFFQEQSVPAIQAAVRQFDTYSDDYFYTNCIQNAAQFSTEKFREQLKTFVMQAVT